MIHHILNHLCTCLNHNIDDCSFFVDKPPIDYSSDKSESEGIYITLFSINENPIPRHERVNNPSLKREVENQDALAFFELNILISAFFKDYMEGLKSLSNIINTLYKNKLYETSGFSLAIEIYNLNLDESANIWQSLSIGMLPFVSYKISAIKIVSNIENTQDLDVLIKK